MPTNSTTSVELLLIRHGESAANQERRFGGHSAAPLTALGERQAEATARVVAARGPIAALHSSDLLRAVATARPLAALAGVEAALDPALRERSVGELTGLTFDQAKERHPATWNDLLRRNLDVRPPGGESLRDCALRISAFVDELLARHVEGRIVLVSHGVAIDALLRHLLGVADGGDGVRCLFHSDNCAIHHLERRGSGPLRVVRLNDASHLAGIATDEQR